MTDLRTLVRGVRVPPELVTIVAIDDAIVKHGGTYPISRIDLAKIIDVIAQLQPAVIAVDLLLVDRGTEEGDEALARSLRGRPVVIAAAAVFPEDSQLILEEGNGPLARLPQAERFLLPLNRFADQAAIGIVNVTTDRSGTPISFPMLFRAPNGFEMSFPLRIAAIATGKQPILEPNRLVVGERYVITDVDHALPITFYGPRRTFPTIGAASVLAGEIAADAIRQRIVVIGATVTGSGDFFPTPFDSLMPGVEVISTAITHLLAGDDILRNQSVRFADHVSAIVLPMILLALLSWRRTSVGLPAALIVVVMWASVNTLAFSWGIWLSAALPMAAATPPVVLGAAVQLWSGRRSAQYFARRNELLEQFQAPEIQKWLAHDPDFLREPVHQKAAVVFIDLSGFTALSERLGPDPIRELLKDFHDLVDKEAVISGGMITSFLGDGAMILFGLPQPKTEDASSAARCSAELCVNTERWLAALPLSIRSVLGFKVGAHFGAIVASRLGGGSFCHITATGDTVNVASRLMDVAARHQVGLCLSDEMLHVAGRDGPLFEAGVLTGPVETNVRGRSAALTVWLWQSNRLS